MVEALKLKFEPDLSYQRGAIDSTVDLFQGMPLANAEFSISAASDASLRLTELGIGNPVPSDIDAFNELLLPILENLGDPASKSMALNPPRAGRTSE